VKYQAEFEAVAGEWLNIDLKWDEFAPSARGQRVVGAPLLTGRGGVCVTV